MAIIFQHQDFLGRNPDPYADFLLVLKRAKSRPEDAGDKSALRAWAHYLLSGARYGVFTREPDLAEDLANKAEQAFEDLLREGYRELAIVDGTCEIPADGDGDDWLAGALSRLFTTDIELAEDLMKQAEQASKDLSRGDALETASPDGIYEIPADSSSDMLMDFGDLLGLRMTMANIYSSQGRWADCETLLEKIVQAREKQLGPMDANTIRAQVRLIDVLHNTMQLDRAEELADEVFAKTQSEEYQGPKVLGVEDLVTAYGPRGLHVQAEVVVNLKSAAGRLAGNTWRKFPQDLAKHYAEFGNGLFGQGRDGQAGEMLQRYSCHITLPAFAPWPPNN